MADGRSRRLQPHTPIQARCRCIPPTRLDGHHAQASVIKLVGPCVSIPRRVVIKKCRPRFHNHTRPSPTAHGIPKHARHLTIRQHRTASQTCPTSPSRNRRQLHHSPARFTRGRPCPPVPAPRATDSTTCASCSPSGNLSGRIPWRRGTAQASVVSVKRSWRTRRIFIVALVRPLFLSLHIVLTPCSMRTNGRHVFPLFRGNPDSTHSRIKHLLPLIHQQHRLLVHNPASAVIRHSNAAEPKPGITLPSNHIGSR